MATMYTTTLTVIAVHGDTDQAARQAYLDEQRRMKTEQAEAEPVGGWPVAECAVTLVLQDPAYLDDRADILVREWDLVTGIKAGDTVTVTITR